MTFLTQSGVMMILIRSMSGGKCGMMEKLMSLPLSPALLWDMLYRQTFWPDGAGER